MATVAQVIHENDVVALRADVKGDDVANWGAGTEGTAVSIYDTAALVEFSDDQGRMLDLVTVPYELLEVRWHRNGA